MTLPIKRLLATDFVELRKTGVVIDVRTPAEYAKGHIPGSHNLPLFSNEERAIVGTLYVQEGREPAILKGLELVGPKLRDLAEKAQQLANQKPLFLYCWRGGMRSSSMAWLLQTMGLEVQVLEGGYKAYRRHFKKMLQPGKWQFINLGGRTGSGKTEILTLLHQKGQQVIDLEQLACHKGSAFGAMGQLPQPSNEHFENLLHEALLKMNPQLPIWVEGESQSIGAIFIPDEFYHLTAASPFINLMIPREERINRLVRDYAIFPPEQLLDAVTRIKKRLGGLVFNEACEAVQTGNYARVADLTLNYYDKTYDYGFHSRNTEKVIAEYPTGNPETIANDLLENVIHKLKPTLTKNTTSK
jgi:tRNA 2-selenouridine synthase